MANLAIENHIAKKFLSGSTLQSDPDDCRF